MQHAYGWVPDVPDFKALRYTFRPKGIIRPPVVYNIVTPVKNQLTLGSCGPHAVTEHLEAVMFQNNMANRVKLSPLAAYEFYGEKTGTVGVDGGVSINLLFQVLAQTGVPTEQSWPYDLAKFGVAPPQAVRDEALHHKILSYHPILGGREYQLACLAEGYGFVCGISVYESFESDYVEQTGIVPIPDRREKFMGGHAIYVWGYNEDLGGYWCQNSWGEWGCQAPTTSERGFFFLPLEYLDPDRYLSSNFWTIRVESE
jgi:hypothetical protein